MMASQLSSACLALLVFALSVGSISGLARCSSPFKSIGEYCYFISDPKTENYVEAREACTNIGATLAILNTGEKNTAIKEYLTLKHKSGLFYVGGYDQPGHESEFLWDPTGTPFNFTNWYPGHPKIVAGPNCVAVDASGYWHDISCSQSLPYICQTISEYCYEEQQSFYNYCRYPYINIGQKCYMINTVNRRSSTWLNAKEYCEEGGSTLAILNSADSNSALTTYLQRYYSGYSFWIGAYDAKHERRWVWNGSGANVTVSNWYYGGPSYSTSSNCAIISYENQYQWADKNCYATYPFVCQQVSDWCVNSFVGL